ncbi:MAG: hypothetical protein Q9160_009248 [Pyrenula sp. 1 TL-2023]
MNILQAVGFASLASVVASSPVHAPFIVGQEVDTTSGIVRGHAAVNRTQVSEYLGIPFAKPPVNDLRFAAPEPYRSDAPFDASSFGTTCLTPTAPVNFSVLANEVYQLAPTAEQFTNINSENGLSLGEDCLTLNVWAKPQTGETAKAVLFFIYGGGGYRVNVFGFPGLQPEVSGVAANAGLLDQRLAIEWARDNVAGFGGDPARITLFGQSAGSISISLYGYAYAHDPIAHGLITQSGTVDSFGPTPANTTLAWQYMAGLLGCGNNTNSTSPEILEQSVDCVRSKPAAQVLAASRQTPFQASSLGVFSPTADGKTIFANYSTLTDQRLFAQLPRLLGSTAQEGRYFQLQLALTGLNLPTVFWDFFTLVIFGCPTVAAASDFAALGSQPVWRYRYNGDYPNTQLTTTPSLGAYHGAELRPLFGLASVLGIPDTPAEYATGKLMRAAWAAFAKDPANALSAPPFSWPTYSDARVVELGVGNATTATIRPSAGSDDDLCPQLMPGFEALGGSNGLLTYGLGAVQQLQNLKDGNVTQVLDVLLQAAGLGGGGERR